MAKESVGENQSKRKGYASLSLGSAKSLRESKQTLCVNAAMEGKEKRVLSNEPWLIELDLPVLGVWHVNVGI